MAENKKKTASAPKKKTAKEEPERDAYAYYDDLYEKKPRKNKSVAPSRKGDDSYEEVEVNKARRYRKKPEPDKDIPPESTKTIHRFMPFILGIATVFVVACLMLASIEGAMGILGEVLRNLFFGLFGWPAWIIPVILINLIIYWRRYVDLALVRRKIIFGASIPVLLSSLVHSIAIAVIYKNGYGWSEWGNSLLGTGGATSNWGYGIDLHGGGFIGGLFGGFFRCLAGYIGSVIILIAFLAVAAIFYFGLTPRQLTDAVTALYKKLCEKAAARKAAKAEAEKEFEDEAEPENDPEDELPKSRRPRKKPAVISAAGSESEDEADEDDSPAVIGGSFDRPLIIEADPVEHIGTIETEHALKETKRAVPSIRPVNETEDPASLGGLVDNIFYKAGKTEIVPAPAEPTPQPVLELTEARVKDPADTPDDTESDGIVPPEVAKKRREFEQLSAYIFPPLSLLRESTSPGRDTINAELHEKAQTLLETLESFKIKLAKIEYLRGPTLTRYELYPSPGVSVNSITSRQNDIAMALKNPKIRIEAPIPGKSAIGIEVPNTSSSSVAIRELLESEQFKNSKNKLLVCLGKDITGDPIFMDISKMPHLLIAGTTGSGKSVCINSIIISLLYKARPDEVQLIMIDPKKVEMSMYNKLPHLRVPVVTDVKKAAGTLNAACVEMDRRYELFEGASARDIDGYNRIMKMDDPDFVPLPRMIIIIDELADLMMTAPSEIESSIVRIAQKARAAGIHLIVGTQRPSVDVITGLIKANIPSRIAFAVASSIDSRIIIDGVGADKLLGRGDMLFRPIGATDPMRVQGTFVNDDEVIAVTNFVKENSANAHYDEEFLKTIETASAQIVTVGPGGKKVASSAGGNGDCFDELFFDALTLAVESGTIATSFLQRSINVGFGRGARIIDRMAKLGFVTPLDGTKPRQVLLTAAQFAEMQARGDKRIYGIIPPVEDGEDA